MTSISKNYTIRDARNKDNFKSDNQLAYLFVVKENAAALKIALNCLKNKSEQLQAEFAKYLKSDCAYSELKCYFLPIVKMAEHFIDEINK